MSSDRVLIVANRLPMTIGTTSQGAQLLPSSGGLVSGLRPWHEQSRGRWLGWPGDLTDVEPSQRSEIELTLGKAGMTAVDLPRQQVDGYYDGFANKVLWPLFHYSVDRMQIDATGWAAYRDVNEAFAREVVREYRPGDTIWVHDYHLMLLPALLRERLPRARIGFFLHIPFPSADVFRVLPWRREMLKGMLGADLVGFHTFGYMRNFIGSLLCEEGIATDVDRVRVGDRDVTVGVFPMGIDAAGYAALASDPEVRARVEAIRQEAGGRRIVLGVDRLDYTKGIPRRLEALARLFDNAPALRDGLRYIQVAVPSRGGVDTYQQFRREVEEIVGRMNATYGTLRSLPVHYVHQSVALPELVALYCAADVMLVTPLRDGMNLVAKEFAASRVDDDGVLVLSEFAGAAAELQGAVMVNPYEVNEFADGIGRALEMRIEERRARMHGLRRHVMSNTVFEWADGFIRRLSALRPDHVPIVHRPPERTLAAVLGKVRHTRSIRLLLDYDGALLPIARAPELALPDDELLLLLEDLASSRGIEIDIVSGRPREFLERWFGDLPLSLWAEHGFWSRRYPDTRWHAAMPLASDCMARVKPILEQFTASTPGARLEVKSSSIAWHYREASRDFGRRQASELRMLLGDLISNQPIEMLDGKMVIEVRMRGVGKGIVARRIRDDGNDGGMVVAIGDDHTDDEMFRALPADGISVAVGPVPSRARFRLADHLGVRSLLRSLLEPSFRESPNGRHDHVAIA